MVLKRAVRRFLEINGPFLASGLAFDILLYFIPLLFLIVSVLGYALASSNRALSGIEEGLRRLTPTAHQAIGDLLTAVVARRNHLGLLGFAMFLVLSTAVFGSVRTVLNTIFEMKPPRGFLKRKGMDFLMMLAAFGLFILTVGMASLPALVSNLGKEMPFLNSVLRSGWGLASHVLGFLFALVLFHVLYRFCPARSLGRQALWAASLTGTVLFELSKWIFAAYVSMAKAYVLLYGALSGILFFILWVYYVSAVFIFAATVGYEIERRFDGPDP